MKANSQVEIVIHLAPYFIGFLGKCVIFWVILNTSKLKSEPAPYANAGPFYPSNGPT